MALTRSFKELVQRNVAADPAFGEALLREGIDTMLTGDIDTGKAILRDYIKATIGFEKLGAPGQGRPLNLYEPEPWPQPVDGAALPTPPTSGERWGTTSAVVTGWRYIGRLR
jgi:hypothetical protein